MSEPRTRTAAEVADHAADVLTDVQRLAEDDAMAGDVRVLASIVERLAAQVEDLASRVAPLDVAAETLTAHEMLVEAIEATLDVCDRRDGWNLPEALSHALTEVAVEQGTDRLTEHRPGSWEADHVRALDMSSLR